MKKNSNTTETAIAAEVIAQQIAQNVPNTPSVRAIMFRINAIVNAAKRSTAADETARANWYGLALIEIGKATQTYWKHHANA